MVVAIAVAVALRVWVLSSSTGGVDSDEAVVALMARGILHHGRHPAFYWGQAYGGTLEPALLAASFAVVGSSLAAVKAVPLALCALGAVLVGCIARRVSGDFAAPFAGALFLVYPPAFIWWSTKERGFYWVSLLSVLAGLLLVLRVEHTRPVPKRLDVAGLGVVVGVGWWTSPQTMFVLAPALVWMLVRRRDKVGRLSIAVPAALVGAVPWLAWNIDHDFRSLRQPVAAMPSTYLDRLHLFFARLLPTVLGVRRPFTGDWLFGSVVGVALYVAALAALAVVAVYAWRQRNAVALLLVLVAVSYPFLFAVPNTSYFVSEPRYGLMLAPVIVLLVSLAAPRPAAQLTVVVIASLLAFSTVRTTIDVADANPASGDLSPPSSAQLDRLARTLDHAHIDQVYADYWIAYALTFETKERISATPTSGTRNLALRSQVATAPRSTYVAFKGQPLDDALPRTFEQHSARYRHLDVGEFSVYFVDRRVDPGEIVTSRSGR